MNEEYIVCIRYDEEYNEGEIVVMERIANGSLAVVNIIYNVEELGELYERLTRREL